MSSFSRRASLRSITSIKSNKSRKSKVETPPPPSWPLPSSAEASDSLPSSLSSKTFQNFYPLFLLYHLITPEGGPVPVPRKSGNSENERRRDFLDAFVSLCDIDHSYGTTTAAALQKSPQGIILWLAANDTMQSRVEEFANWLIARLDSVNKYNDREAKKEILIASVDCAATKIDYYANKLAGYVHKCHKAILDRPSNAGVQVQGWLDNLLGESPMKENRKQLVSLCYAMRGSKIDEIKSLSDGNDCFGRLAHYINRLGNHYIEVSHLVDCAISTKSLLKIAEIKIAPSSRPTIIPLPSDLYELPNLIKLVQNCQGPAPYVDSTEALHALVDIYYNSPARLRERLIERDTIATKVHAELILLDIFNRSEFEFIGNDKYISTSTPACYFCYNWITLHHRVFVRPATRNTIVLGCRGPDHDMNSKGIGHYTEMYTKMTRQLEHDVIKRLKDLEAEKRAQLDMDTAETLGSAGRASSFSAVTGRTRSASRGEERAMSVSRQEGRSSSFSNVFPDKRRTASFSSTTTLPSKGRKSSMSMSAHNSGRRRSSIMSVCHPS